jgi:hypothetical protein
VRLYNENSGEMWVESVFGEVGGVLTSFAFHR